MQDEFERPPVPVRFRNYGPTILGALIVLAIVVGGVWFFQTRTKEEKQQVAQQTPIPYPTIAPESTPQDTQSPKSVTQLPATGAPLIPLGAVSLALLTGGIILRKISK